MTSWIDRMQYHIDSMEDPRCCTKPEPLYCDQCKELVLSGAEWFLKDGDFCSEECLLEWSEKNFEE